MSVIDEMNFSRHTFKKGEVILKEGQPGRAAYIILRGKVEIRKRHLSENPQFLATRSRGEVIGELSLFDDTPRAASVIALEDTEVNAMSREEFQRRLEYMDPTMRGIIKMVVRWAREMADDVAKTGRDVNW